MEVDDDQTYAFFHLLSQLTKVHKGWLIRPQTLKQLPVSTASLEKLPPTIRNVFFAIVQLMDKTLIW